MELSLYDLRRPRRTVFATFYSYKGGVGRTMALLNVGARLAGLGRRVFLIDFDLEAPGLTHFQKRQGSGEPSSQRGLVDLVREFLSNPDQSALVDLKPDRLFQDFTCEIKVPDELQRQDGGLLHLMPAGCLESEYKSALHSIHFGQLYKQGIGYPIFERLKTILRESRQYDYVLIDSRTGLSDEGSICTRHLADYLVVLTGLNRQNLEGTSNFLSHLHAGGWKKAVPLFVASPIPPFYEDYLQRRLKDAKQIIHAAGFDTEVSILLPYHPLLALDEQIFLDEGIGTDLGTAYDELVKSIRTWADDRPEDIFNATRKAAAEDRADDALEGLRSLVKERSNFAEVAGRVITDQMSKSMVLRERATEFFELLLDVAEDKAAVLVLQGKVYATHSQYEPALASFKEALAEFEEVGDQQGAAVASLGIGRVYLVRGEYEPALASFREALATFEETGDRASVAGARLDIGRVHLNRGEYEPALASFNEALATFEEVEDWASVASTRLYIGRLYSDRGEYEPALASLEGALTTFEEVGDQASAAGARLNIGRVYSGRGEYEPALASFKEGLLAYEEVGDRHNAASVRLDIGRLYSDRGEYEPALASLEGALATFEEVGDRLSAALVHLDIGRVYSGRGEYEPALASFRKALATFESEEDSFSISIVKAAAGRVFVRQGESAEGLKLIQAAIYEARAVDSPTWQAELQTYLAEALVQTDPTAALALLGSVWNEIEHKGSVATRMQAHVARAQARVALGDPDGAAADAQLAATFYNSQGVDNDLAEEAERIIKETSTDALWKGV